MQCNLVIFVIFAHLLQCVHPYKSGAPQRACDSMRPGHNADVQTFPSPFVVKAETRGNSVQVTIEGLNSTTLFRGFLLKAFYQDGTDVNNGKFSTNSESHTLDCGFGNEGALTHNNNNDKSVITTTWSPPPGSHNVIFRASIVVVYEKFWVSVESNPVRSTSLSTTAMPSSSVLPVVDLYTGCGFSKGCFGFPGNCVEKRSCEFVLTYASVSDMQYMEFQLVGALGSNSGWIAVGLSRDNKMGDDSVTECVLVGDKVLVRESWNYATSSGDKGNFLLSGPKNITDEKWEYENGVITCSWNRPFSTVANGYTFNIAEERFYLLLAKGPVDSSGGKRRHTSELVSANPVDITSATLVVGKLTTLIKIHGTFMTAGWICFVSIGILLARHFKEVWTKYKLCGGKVWFAVHRCCMLLSVALVVVGFIVIFIDVDGWSQVGRNPHPLFGCIATGLIVLQPLIAACRPHPTAATRPIFRWIHGLVGNGAHLIAVINMFFAVSLKKSNIPQAFSWVLVTFVIFYCLVHLLIHIHSCFMERERERESHAKSNQFQVGDGYDINEDGPGSAFKRFALGLYCLVVVCLTAALILMICLN